MKWEDEVDAAQTDSKAALISRTREESAEHLRDALAHIARAIEELEGE